jgi:uroporphyrinogen decarboxylase
LAESNSGNTSGQSTVAGAGNGGSVPVIVFSLGTHNNWEELAATGANVLGIDWRFPLAQAREVVPDTVGLQGNLAPALLIEGSPETVSCEATRLLMEMRARRGYIFNLGHGLTPGAKLDNIGALVQTVRNWTEPC